MRREIRHKTLERWGLVRRVSLQLLWCEVGFQVDRDRPIELLALVDDGVCGLVLLHAGVEAEALGLGESGGYIGLGVGLHLDGFKKSTRTEVVIVFHRIFIFCDQGDILIELKELLETLGEKLARHIGHGQVLVVELNWSDMILQH